MESQSNEVSNKENQSQGRQMAAKTCSSGRLPLRNARTNTDGGEKEKRGFMKRMLRGPGRGGGRKVVSPRNTSETGAGDGNEAPEAALPCPALSQSTSTLRAGGAKKNFVKANKLAAASARNLRSASHLKASTPGVSAGLQVTSSKLGGSSRSLNSTPGSGGRGGSRSRPRQFSRQLDSRQSFHFGSRSVKARDVSPAVTRKSLSSAPEIVVTPSIPKSVRRPRPPHQAGVLSARTEEEEEYLGPAHTSKRETIESLTVRLEQLTLEVEKTRRENSELMTRMEMSQKENKKEVESLSALIEKTSRKHEEDLKNVLEMSKCQLESQRLEFKEEIRKLLSFKDPVNKSKEKDGNVQSGKRGQDNFRNTSDRLLNKIQRLSARMSLQDSDMKELIEVKSWNERKLESELQKLDSAKKTPPGDCSDLLQSSGSRSESDLAAM